MLDTGHFTKGGYVMLMESRNGPIPGTALRDTLRVASDLVGVPNCNEL